MSNHALMLPSERYKEHLQIKASQRKWKEDREATFKYKKRMNIIEMSYPGGVVGVDGPLHADTKLWANRRGQLTHQEGIKASHATARAENLNERRKTDDATSAKNYGSDTGIERGRDLGIQRKKIDTEAHPWRFMDTHDRLFPSFTPTWDHERASMLRSHDTRGKTHNIISGADNTIVTKVASVPHGLAASGHAALPYTD
jgi:hypothetical protein